MLCFFTGDTTGACCELCGQLVPHGSSLASMAVGCEGRVRDFNKLNVSFATRRANSDQHLMFRWILCTGETGTLYILHSEYMH